MHDYNVVVELPMRSFDDDTADSLITQLESLSPSVALSEAGWVEVTTTVGAKAPNHAINTVLGLLDEVVSVTVMTTDEYDRRQRTAPAELQTMSVAEVAEWVAMSRQRVQQLIADGTLPAERLGREWRIQVDTSLEPREWLDELHRAARSARLRRDTAGEE